MFSALSSFFFGGEKASSSAETPLNYDLKEDDEWMIVDVSGDKENLSESVAKNRRERKSHDHERVRNDEGEIDNHLDKGGEEEVFEYLPHLPNSDNQIFPSNFIHPISISSSFESFSEIPPSLSCIYSLYELFPDTSYSPLLQTVQNENPIILSNKKTKCENGRQFQTKLVTRGIIKDTKVLCDITCSTTSVINNLPTKHKEKATRNKHSVSIVAVKAEGTTTKVHRVLGETRTPLKLSKTEYMQHIQGLIPSQQAKEYESKKYVKKAQLNRKNRVCMYESSNKTPHRRDSMRQHFSGANNNRKCY